MTDEVVSVRGFTKRYGSAVSVDKVDFSLARGEIPALLGPDGGRIEALGFFARYRGIAPSLAAAERLGLGGRTRIAATTARGELVSPDFPEADRLPPEEGYAVYRSSKPGKTLAALLAWLDSVGAEVLDLRVERPTLENRFLEIVGRRAARATSVDVDLAVMCSFLLSLPGGLVAARYSGTLRSYRISEVSSWAALAAPTIASLGHGPRDGPNRGTVWRQPSRGSSPPSSLRESTRPRALLPALPH
jgi:hypothetical protein